MRCGGCNAYRGAYEHKPWLCTEGHFLPERKERTYMRDDWEALQVDAQARVAALVPALQEYATTLDESVLRPALAGFIANVFYSRGRVSAIRIRLTRVNVSADMRIGDKHGRALLYSLTLDEEDETVSVTVFGQSTRIAVIVKDDLDYTAEQAARLALRYLKA